LNNSYRNSNTVTNYGSMWGWFVNNNHHPYSSIYHRDFYKNQKAA
jgi:hypothetical protein